MTGAVPPSITIGPRTGSRRPSQARVTHSPRYGHIRDRATSAPRGAVHGARRDAQHHVARAAVPGSPAVEHGGGGRRRRVALAYLLAGRERGFGRIAAAPIPLELAADTVFTTGQHVCYGAAGGPVAGPLRSVGWDVFCGDGTSVGSPLARMTGTDTDRLGGLLAHADPQTAWLLLAAHVSLGLLAAAWLRRGSGPWPSCCGPWPPPPSGRCSSRPPR
ncbi:hypothetical protein SGRIM119S_08497 [Streptomyces griseorubiginosus]